MVYWDGNRSADIYLSDEFKSYTKGLCGTFNGNKNDEFTDFSGTVQANVGPFAESFISDDCTVSPISDPTCDYECTVLDRSEFQACVGVVNKEVFKALCKKDVCADRAQTSAAECAILEKYSKQCSMNGITLDWRGPGLCGK